MSQSKEFVVKYSEFQSEGELSSSEVELVRRAKQVLTTSYSPYSHFRVGAAVLLENGEIISGSNQENGAYPSGLCAERVALFYAGAKYPKVPVVSIAIVASYMDEIVQTPISPCGACRQVMIEYRNIGAKPYSVIMVGQGKIVKVEDVRFLLPFSFSNVEDATK
ncbi:MAG: cytidine deaminase [Bacteroidales bacterium]|nr:MAG: cytidine deaminase [Bacteroidales bacterium]